MSYQPFKYFAYVQNCKAMSCVSWGYGELVELCRRHICVELFKWCSGTGVPPPSQIIASYLNISKYIPVCLVFACYRS